MCLKKDVVLTCGEHSGASIHELSSTILGKMALVMFVTQCGIHEQKQHFAEHFCLWTELFANRSIGQLRYYCTIEMLSENYGIFQQAVIGDHKTQVKRVICQNLDWSWAEETIAQGRGYRSFFHGKRRRWAWGNISSWEIFTIVLMLLLGKVCL